MKALGVVTSPSSAALVNERGAFADLPLRRLGPVTGA